MNVSVFDFDDYRKYLKAYYEEGRKVAALSLSHFSLKAGLNSPNYLKLVFDGKRNLTTENIFSFAKALKLSAAELLYFESLVHCCQAKSSQAKNFYQKRLNAAKTKRTQSRQLPPTGFTTEWFYPACCVAAHGRTQEQTIQFLKTNVGISAKQTLLALQKLTELKILSLDSEKAYMLSGNFSTIHDPRHLDYSQERYLQDQVEISRNSFKRHYKRGTGKYISQSMTTPENGALILRDDFLELLATKSQNFDEISTTLPKLLQINIQIFEVQNPDKT